MGLASTFEDIAERLDEAQRTYAAAIGVLRDRVHRADWSDAGAIETDIRVFRDRVSSLLDEVEARTNNIFEAAKRKLREASAAATDPDVKIVARLQKKEAQLASARKERDEAKENLEKVRNDLAKAERIVNSGSEERKKMREESLSLKRENESLLRQLADCREFRDALKK